MGADLLRRLDSVRDKMTGAQVETGAKLGNAAHRRAMTGRQETGAMTGRQGVRNAAHRRFPEVGWSSRAQRPSSSIG